MVSREWLWKGLDLKLEKQTKPDLSGRIESRFDILDL